MRIRHAALLSVALLAGTACGEHEFQPTSDEARFAEADSLYSAALFDTVSWASDSARTGAGNLVYADHCRRCHGPLGRGDTPYAAENDLRVPSLVEPDWQFADDPEGIRRLIFTGHPGGMRAWGIGRLTPRQIDAAAHYILGQLRPEVLADTTARIPAGL